MAKQVLKEIECGVEFSSDEYVLRAYSQDLWPRKLLAWRENGPPAPTIAAVFWPRTTAEVQKLVNITRDKPIVLIPYGAGSGVCGATVPEIDEVKQVILIDLKHMRAIRRLDVESNLVEAEAGWIGENLERELNFKGFTLGHFPSSIYCSSLGGYLATRSAGQLSTKYGKIEDLVVSLEMVNDRGEVLKVGRAPRSAMGPDWTQFLLGSEGTLGIFTAAELQIHKLPEGREFLAFEAESTHAALKFCQSIMQGGLRPAAVRIYDELESALALKSEILKEAGYSKGATIVVVYEGNKQLIATEKQVTEQWAKDQNIRQLGSIFASHWYNHRYDVSYKQQLIVSHDRIILDTFEIAATYDKLMNVYHAVKAKRPTFGVMLAHFSHFYHTGANIYFSFVSHTGPFQTSVELYDTVWKEIMTAALEEGATLSHHHGVGTMRSEWMKKELGPFVGYFKSLKEAFDEKNRFNPGKMGL